MAAGSQSTKLGKTVLRSGLLASGQFLIAWLLNANLGSWWFWVMFSFASLSRALREAFAFFGVIVPKKTAKLRLAKSVCAETGNNGKTEAAYSHATWRCLLDACPVAMKLYIMYHNYAYTDHLKNVSWKKDSGIRPCKQASHSIYVCVCVYALQYMHLVYVWILGQAMAFAELFAAHSQASALQVFFFPKTCVVWKHYMGFRTTPIWYMEQLRYMYYILMIHSDTRVHRTVCRPKTAKTKNNIINEKYRNQTAKTILQYLNKRKQTSHSKKNAGQCEDS